MIGWDGPSRAVKWFHFSCAGIERGGGISDRGRMALCSVQVFLIL